MPHVHITWLEGRTPEQKRKVAEKITQALQEEANAKPEAVHVAFVDIPSTNFADAGVILADRKRPS
jgi:4-oxalocrotonate tautomerase